MYLKMFSVVFSFFFLGVDNELEQRNLPFMPREIGS